MNSKRLYQLDLIRFLAALYVVFYHYCFRGYNKDNMSNISYNELEFFSKYGYLGVDLFFMISGFVILLSVTNSNIFSFITSRISRLYPAYWVCLIITATVMLTLGGESFSTNIYIIVANLTMFNGFFNIEYVDGVYWSLLVELKFYLIIGLIMITKKTKYLLWIMYLWLSTSIIYLFSYQNDPNLLIKLIGYFLIPKWSHYFIAGMIFYLIKKNQKIKAYIIPLIICFSLSIAYGMIKVDFLNTLYYNVFSNFVVYIFIASFYLIFFLISVNKLNSLNKVYYYKLGILTYPLYLLHQNIGFITINNLSPYINRYLLLLIILAVMLVSSYYISTKLEKPLGKFIKKTLIRHIGIKKNKP